MASAFRRKDRRGKLSATYTIRFRDRYGRRLTRSTSCRSRSEALALAHQLEGEWQRVRLGLVRAADLEKHDALDTAIDAASKHYAEYLADRKRSAQHVYDTAYIIRRAASLAGIAVVREITPGRLDQLKTKLLKAGRTARTVNRYTGALRALLAFMSDGSTARLTEQPKRKRRAFTPNEFARLLADPRVIETSRRLVYLFGVRTGLRFSEIGRVRWSHLDLEHAVIRLPKECSKNDRSSVLPIASDLAAVLVAARPMAITDARVFPRRVARPTWQADLARAGIEYATDDDRYLGMHSLRHTFDTWLFRSGATEHVVTWLMRHSRGLTTGTYADKEQMLPELGDAVERMVRWAAKQVEDEAKKRKEAAG